MEQQQPGFQGTVGDVAEAALTALQRPSNEVERAYDALEAMAELEGLLAACEGYLRAGVGQDGLFYLRYKWTRGALAERYTFGSGRTLCAATEALLANVQAVLAGKRGATKDTPYRR